MRTICKALLATLLAVSALPAKAEFITIRDLIANLASPNQGKQMHALGYITGAADLLISAKIICVPPGTTAGAVRESVSSIIVAVKGDSLEESAISYVSYTLQFRYPCAESKDKPRAVKPNLGV